MQRSLIAGLAAGLAGLGAVAGAYLWPGSAPTAPPVAATVVADAVAPASPAPPAPPPLVTEVVQIRPRDTLTTLLVRSGLPPAETHALAGRLRAAGLNMRAIRVGDAVELARDAAGELQRLVYAPSPWQRFEAQWAATGWEASVATTEPEVRVELRAAEIRNSLWDAVDTGGISAQTVLGLVGIFESSFDFTADTRPGDRLQMLVEARYANGRFVDDARILAAQYTSAGSTLTGIAFEVNGRAAHYDPDGRSLRKMFLRSPLQFSRISSRYTYARPHPVLGGTRPHLAVDYAAPTGTPVWAVADGTVEFAGHKGGNGIQVLLRHRAGYRTYYNHLSRVAKGVRAGARVSQKQVIGYVGSTGISTGPHLDYRVSVNGSFVNPLAEKFLPGEPIPAPLQAQFQVRAQALLAQLQAGVSTTAPAAPQAVAPATPAS